MDQTSWLIDHPVFRALASEVICPPLLVSYVEGFAPVVNSVPAFLHLTLTRAEGKASSLLRDIWNDELGLSGTSAHPVLFDHVHHSITKRWGRSERAQEYGIDAAVQMIQLCGSGPWPIGVAAMKAHESQFPAAYEAILPSIGSVCGAAAEFFVVHSAADVEHTEAGRQLLVWGIDQGIISSSEADSAFNKSTQILRKLMDGMWSIARPTVE